MNAPLLTVDDLCIDFRQGTRLLRAVDACSFSIEKGEMLALVGESGSGKSVSALAIMGLLPKPAGVVSRGSVVFDGVDLLKLPEDELNAIRGNRISMVFQEPMTALNPVLTSGWQLKEVMRQHLGLTDEECESRAAELLGQVGIPSPQKRLKDYPHQFSGGMRQRVMIAMALACSPDLIIADEPTTALDVTVQAQIMALLDDLRKRTGTAILLITHNLALVRQKADRVAVMYAGNIVETSPCGQIFSHPSHPYTRLLLAAVPSASARGTKLSAIAGQVPEPGTEIKGCRFQPRCPYADDGCASRPVSRKVAENHFTLCPKEFMPAAAESSEVVENQNENAAPLLKVEKLNVRFPIKKSMFGNPVFLHAVNDVSFSLHSGESLAIVGESGCGKTTLGKAILRLVQAESGDVRIGDSPNLAAIPLKQMRPWRKKITMVFQDPFSSLDPRMMISETVGQGCEGQFANAAERKEFLEGLIRQVGLPADSLYRYPHQFSGGQRQRIGLARALAPRPEIVICDECTSALDVSVQAQILNLLCDLKRSLHLSYIFITHDLSVVSYIADRIAIMYLGQIVEIGDAMEVLEHPHHPYTQCLLASAPRIDGSSSEVAVKGEMPSPLNPPTGCPFHPRCPHATKACAEQQPEWKQTSTNSKCRCHLC